MPDNPPEPSDADLADVRRLLRAARADEPMPVDVVARLDETLAGLVAERSAATAPTGAAPDGELAARRARRRRFVGGAGLVAAAAVVAAGFLGQIVSDDGPDGSTAESGGSSESMNEAPADAAPDAAAPTEAPEDLQAERDVPGASAPDLPLSDDDQRAVTYALEKLSDSKTWGYSSQRGATQRKFPEVIRCGDWNSRATLVDPGLDRKDDDAPADLMLALEPRRTDGTRSAHLVDCQATPPVTLQSVEIPAFD